jgi:hypothetical protein
VTGAVAPQRPLRGRPGHCWHVVPTQLVPQKHWGAGEQQGSATSPQSRQRPDGSQVPPDPLHAWPVATHRLVTGSQQLPGVHTKPRQHNWPDAPQYWHALALQIRSVAEQVPSAQQGLVSAPHAVHLPAGIEQSAPPAEHQAAAPGGQHDWLDPPQPRVARLDAQEFFWQETSEQQLSCVPGTHASPGRTHVRWGGVWLSQPQQL